MMAADLDAQLAGLDHLGIGDLRARWTAVTGRVVPTLSAPMLRLALAWEMQARAHGGLSRTSQQRLAQFAAAKTVTRSAVPGMRLIREWNGTTHVVTVNDGGEVEWSGRTWRSLSEVAREITGTRWSGPAFFGLRQTKKAA